METIARVQPDEPDVQDLLQCHFALMRAQTPEESCHVLPVSALSAENVSVFVLRDKGKAVAVAALRLTGTTAELKSMYTAEDFRKRGAARRLLVAIIGEARVLGVRRLNLETGSGAEHAAARRLYAAQGFDECPPFGDYRVDPLSIFMTQAI